MIFAYEYSKFVTTSVFFLITLTTIVLAIKPRLIALPYWASILLFTGTMYGVEDVTSTLYSRGVGYLGTPLITIFLSILFVFYSFYTRLSGPKQRLSRHPSFLPLSIIIAFYLIYLIYGVSSSLTFTNMLSNKGLINFIYLMMSLAVLCWAVSEESELTVFRNIFLSATLLMCLFGIVRYLIGDGDPANYYKNFELSISKITFFDYGQLLLFVVLASYCFFKRSESGIVKQMFLLSVILLNLFNIMFSLRRNAVLGVFLVFFWIFCISDLKRRIVILISLVLMLTTAVVVFQKRFEQARRFQGKGADITSDIKDKSGNISFRKGRFSELYHAIQIANRSALVGLGPWAVNKPRITQHERGDFVHSSFVHMYVKSGLVGLTLYCWMLLSYCIWWVRERKRSWNINDNRYLAEAFFCGFIFEIPDLVFGTPIIIYRHFQILAMVLAIPYICSTVDRKSNEVSDV